MERLLGIDTNQSKKKNACEFSETNIIYVLFKYTFRVLINSLDRMDTIKRKLLNIKIDGFIGLANTIPLGVVT